MKETSTKITEKEELSQYKLPVCDVQKERRNFPGYSEETYFSLQDIVSGDTAGSTETDSKTDPKIGNYTKINQTSGKGRKHK